MASGIFAKYKGPICILIASLCYSTTGTSQALAPEGATPYVIGAIRLWFGGISLFLWCLATKRLPDLKRIPKKDAFLSAMGILLFQLNFFAAVSITGVAVGTAAICGLIPIMAGVFAFLFLQEKPPLVWYIATLVAITGMFLLSLTDTLSANPLGLFLALTAASSYGIYAVFAKKLTHSGDPAGIIMILFAIGAICVTPVFFLFPTDWIFTVRGMSICLFLGVVATALGYTFYLTGLQTTPVATAATLNLSESIAAACWGIFILGEVILPMHLMGMALIFFSTVALTYKSR